MAKGTGKLRIENNKKVMSALRINGNATKKEIAKQTNLTIATVGTILNDFVASKILIEDEKVLSKKGRPTISYQINSAHHAMLLILIHRVENKNYLHFRFYDAKQELIDEGKQVLGIITPEFVLQRISNIISDYKSPIGQIALYLPGIIEDNIVVSSDIKELISWDIKTLLENKIQLPVLIQSSYGALANGIKQYSNLTYSIFNTDSQTAYSAVKVEGDETKVVDYSYLTQFRKRSTKSIVFTEENVNELLLNLILSFQPEALILSGTSLEKIDTKLIYRSLRNILPDYRNFELFELDYSIDTLFTGAVQTTSDYFWSWFLKQDLEALQQQLG